MGTPDSPEKPDFEFASQEKISRFGELQDDFVREILGLPWAYLTDESCLGDIKLDESNDLLCARIRERYGVDVSDVRDGNIAGILAKIQFAAGRS
jgi:hypothetical protein